MKKILTGIAIVLIIVLFVLTNTIFKGYYGTYRLNDGHEWTDISYEVLEGAADKFEAELSDGQTIKIKYTGKYEFKVLFTLKDDNNESMQYELRLFEKLNTIDDTFDIEYELIQK